MSDNRGISCLGLMHPQYDIQQLMNAFADATEIRFGWIDKFFNAGGDESHGAKILSIPKKKFCRVHIINGPGMNNGRTQPHEITFGETTGSLVQKINANDRRFLDKFEDRVKNLKRLVERATRGELILAVSPWLEHEPIPENSFTKLVQIVHKHLPQALIVDNPRGGGILFPGYLHEMHGTDVPYNRLDITDLDGEDFETIDVRRFGLRSRDCRAAYIWALGDNGNVKGGAWEPPQQRTHWTHGREFKVYKEWITPGALVPQNQVIPRDIAGLAMQQTEDGFKRDFVFKLGEGKPYATVVFPRKFRGQFRSVFIRRNGRILDSARYRGIYSEDGTNRLIYDFRKHPTEFAQNSVLVADRFGWVLGTPAFRID